MKTNRRYHYFKQYCLRTPIFPLSFYTKLTNGEKLSTEVFQEVWKNAVLREAIYLASPSLFVEIEKWLQQPNNYPKSKRLSYSLLKYCSRMATRCTPFGLFAGCTMGKIADSTELYLTKQSNYARQTRFDMNFLVSLGLELSNQPHIRKQLRYFPNTSLYKAGGQLRYVEYIYKKAQRIHSIEAINPTSYLEEVLESAKTGQQITSLAQLLVSTEISFEEAMNYIEELVENQVLVSELEATVSGSDFLGQLIEDLKKLEETTEIIAVLQHLSMQLVQLDQQIGNPINAYREIISTIETSAYSFDKKYLFQTDLFIKASKNQLSKQVLQTVKQGIIVLNKLTNANPDTNLDKFRKAFVRRYEEQEVPLALALDTEMGIGYLQNTGIADDNSLVDDLLFSYKKDKEENLKWDATQDLLHKKLLEAQADNTYEIFLQDEDLRSFEEQWDDLPDTMSMLAEVLMIEGEEQIYFSGLGGSSAANLLGRFCHGEEEILAYTKAIVERDTQLQEDKIRAEIVHLPQARTGNILIRPVLREYEIPYLAKSTLPLEKQLSLSDLLLSVRGGRIILKSKKHNKEVIPQLTNAHNFRNGLPIYQFLCDMQTQQLRSSIYFSWGNVSKNQKFLPRVSYKNLIFSKATWLLGQKDLKPLRTENTASELIAITTKWRQERQMPELIQLVESDNTLVINMKNKTSILMFLDEIKNKTQFILEEFLFDTDGIVKSDKGYYTNQFVFSFSKPQTT